MIVIAVCDDEEQLLSQLVESIEAYMDRTKLEYKIYQFSNAQGLLDSLLQFDIVFLDIQMEGIDGMSAAKKLRENDQDCFFIFVTAFSDYVFEAFEVRATNYLIKPVATEKLYDTLQRIFRYMEQSEKQYLTVQQGQWRMVVKLADIFYCEVIRRKVYIHTKSKVIDYYDKIEDLANHLPENFFRCHRSYLINLQYVCAYENGAVELENGETVPMARQRQQEFSEAMLSYMKCEAW
jgi:DNA-binding LytR/AlgR family response regulator